MTTIPEFDVTIERWVGGDYRTIYATQLSTDEPIENFDQAISRMSACVNYCRENGIRGFVKVYQNGYQVRKIQI